MPLRIAVKRLSAVETDPERSNQHELHAGRLRRELGFPEVRVSGKLVTLIFQTDGRPPTLDESSFTLYDARAGNATRQAEWRLFYSSRVIAELAREGDLLVLYPQSKELRALVVRAGTRIEGDVLRSVELGDDAIRTQFAYLDAPVPEERDAREVASQLTLPESIPDLHEISDHALFRRAIGEGRMPSTIEMADAAASIARARGVGFADPDRYLVEALAAETNLYFAIEDGVQQARLNELIADGHDLTRVIDFAMSIQQSRRSRRGQSLQNHFATILRAEHIPFSAQCTTERGETPDFLVPGCDEYHDPEFLPERLRMVACKTTAKERWRQVLHEAERIPEKYLLTIDPDLTSATIEGMVKAGVLPFIPQSIIADSYAANPERQAIGSVRRLVANLRPTSGGSFA